MSAEDVALRLRRKSVSAQTVREWESGEDAPTYPQLETLAYKIYKRAVAVFFFPEPPQEETISEKFRSLPETDAQNLPPNIRFLVRKAEVFRINLEELFGGMNPVRRRIFRDIALSPDSDMRREAKAVREYLNVPASREERTDSQTALNVWRAKLEDAGIFVFKDSFQNDRYCGFCLNDDEFPLVYLNNNIAKTRQIFTVFHELAHILMQQGGIDFRGERTDDPIEIACNRFAGEVLVPSDDLFGKMPARDLSDDDIRNFASAYCVSREVILRKLLERGAIARRQYAQKIRQWQEEWQERNKRKRKKTGGGDYYANKNAYLSRKYALAALSGYYDNRISADQFADYLGIKPHQINALEKRILKGAES